ncbi:MAG: PAS domain-containing protein [Chitinophagaceae bacterium]|nr:MAG: PAS domain-containing protein [Chitinophagaceae bacterium]
MSVTKQTSSFLAALFDSLPQSVTWSVPVFNADGTIVDFTIGYANESGGVHIGVDHDLMIGKRVFADFQLAPDVRKALFAQYCQVYESGERFETTYYDPLRDKFLHVVRTRADEGVLTLATNVTEGHRAQEELRRQVALNNGILDASINGVLLLEPLYTESGEITDFLMCQANKRFDEISGISFSEVRNQGLKAVFPGISEHQMGLFREVMRDGVPRRDIFPYAAENEERWYDISIVRLGTGCLITYNNITHLRRQQQHLEAKNTEFEAILNAAQTRMLVLKPDGDDFRIRLVNRAYAEFKKTTPEALTGMKASEVFPAPHLPTIFTHYRHTLNTGERSSFDLHCDDPGRVFWLDVCVSRLGAELLVTINDYTRQRLLQLELEQKLRELERSNRNLEEFAYAASHDLKEPIRKVRFFADRLRQQFEPEKGTEAERNFSRLDTATERMRDLVDDLLAYAQVSLRPQHLEEVALSAVIRNVQIDLELEIEQKEASIDAGELPVVRGHQRQLQQLFQNLVANALKYHRTNTRPEIRISARTLRGFDTSASLGPEQAARLYTVITVSDNGIGFEAADAERIFQVFQRLHGNSEYRGTGVGLSIARKVAENHDGFIYAEGRPGNGASFHLGLPA